MIRRVVVGLGNVVLIAGLVIGTEMWLALRRDYLPTDHPLELEGSFGPRHALPLRFVVLGDSTAAGIGVEDAEEAYATLLARRLARETKRFVELTVLGVSGARVRDVSMEQAPGGPTSPGGDPGRDRSQ